MIIKLLRNSLYVLTVITGIFFVACNGTPKPTKGKLAGKSSSKVVKGEAIKTDSAIVTADNVAVTPLPFGSKVLVTYKFPKGWIPTDNDKNPVRTVPEDKHLFKMMQEFAKLDSIRSFKGPQISSKNYILLGSDSLITKDRRVFDSDFRYRLPDMDKYECYYVSHPYRFDNDTTTTPIVRTDYSYYTEIASLILYERKTQLANIINIRYDLSFSDNDYVTSRYFYIDTNKTIKIFECSGDETYTEFKTTQEINVLEGGKIVVKNIK